MFSSPRSFEILCFVCFHWLGYHLLLPLLLLVLLHPFDSLFSMTTWVSRYQKGKTSLDFNEARHDGVFGSIGVSWTTCKQSAPHSRQITTWTPHQSIFADRMLFLMPIAQPTVSKQWRHCDGKTDRITISLSALCIVVLHSSCAVKI